MPSPLRFAVIATMAVLSLGSRSASSGQLYTSATSTDADHITVSWTFYEYPGYIVNRPEWIGYDVFRRTTAPCGAWERLNSEPIPRTVGETHSRNFVDMPHATATTYEYFVRLVDANRLTVSLGSTFSGCDLCVHSSWASAPQFSAPAVVGRLYDQGWALLVTPSCASACFPYSYIPNGTPNFDALRPYAQTQATVRLFGEYSCGTVEGCSLRVDSFAVGPCDLPVSAKRIGWGQLKLLYR